MNEPGNPAHFPGHDAPGEEWNAAGAPEVRFERATSPRPASRGVRTFTWVVLGILALAVIALVVVMATTVGR